MAKTMHINLSPQIIADFESCFEKKSDERAYLYKNSTKKINEGIGDVLIKKTLNVRLVEDGKQIVKPTTLDEIYFETTDMPSNPQWVTKEIAGTLEPYEYIIGASFWDKINDWAKLLFILNSKFNYSIIEDGKKTLAELKSDGVNPTQIKLKEDELEKTEINIMKIINDECIESYTHTLFSTIIIAKIKQAQQEKLDKEFEELNKPKES